MNSMDKIANKFDTTFDQKMNEAVAVIQTEKSQLTEEVKSALSAPIVEIKDRQYLEDKIKGLIDRTSHVLDLMDEEFVMSGGIPPQAKAFMYKTYADVVNAISIQVRELRELSKMCMGLDMINTEQTIKANEEKQIEEKAKQKKFLLSGEDLANLVDAARATSQMQAIKAEFHILNE
jgi:hypothetical protein